MTWLREPVLHFAILGVFIFGVQAALSPANHVDLAVPTATRAALIADFERRLNRPPDPVETQILVDGWIDEELLFREGRRLGLERGDPIVRRRVVQRMKALQRTMYPVEIPDDSELEAWISAHPDRYVLPPSASVEHVFASARRPDPKVRSEALLQALLAGADPKTLGDPFPHDRTLGITPISELANTYGPSFAEVAAKASLNKWTLAPSEFGWHVVRVIERDEGGVATLEDAREAVEQDWMAEQERLVEAEALGRLRKSAGL